MLVSLFSCPWLLHVFVELNEVYKTQEGSMCICSPHPGVPVSCHHILLTTGSMYQQHHHWANSSCYCVDGDGELKAGDGILSSRPDALLANGGSFLPSPSPSNYYLQPPPAIVPPPMASQLHAITHLSPTSSSSGMAVATSSATFRRVLSTGDLIITDREEEQRGAAAARYSAEERRERIDKYRSKRNQRNFQKKITYACRKTLADSRPRVKGRFARNGGDYTEADAVAVADHNVPATAAAPEWWPAVQDELPAGAGINLTELCADDDDDQMLAAYLGVSSISMA